MLEAYHRSAEIMGEVFITPLPLLELGAKLGIGRLRELTDAYDDLERMGDDIVKKRRAMHQATLDRGEEIEQICLLDTMLFLEDPETGERAYTDEELWGDMNDIMAAGHQTQAATMTMALLYVSRNPDVKAKIEAEVRALPDGRAPHVRGRLRGSPRVHPVGDQGDAPSAPPDSHVPAVGVRIGRDAHGAPGGEGRSHLALHVGDGEEPERVGGARDARPGAVLGRAIIRARAVAGGPGRGRGRDRPRGDDAEERPRLHLHALRRGAEELHRGLFSLLTVTTIVASCVRRFDFEPDEKTLPRDAPIPLRYDVTMCYPNGINMKLTRRGAGGKRGKERRRAKKSPRGRGEEMSFFICVLFFF